PAELPQPPVEKRVSTDARDEGLKGKVRSVVEYSMEAAKKTVDKEDYYNSDGNLIRSVDYDNGYPETVSVFGFVDGMRVSRSGTVHYQPGEEPKPQGIFITVDLDTDVPGAKRDERYTERYVRVYNSQNRLIELQRLGNNGKLWSRQTNTYSGDMRT